ncbi:MAG: COR domain-containing protein [Thermoanaerobaculia bacterium]
MRHRPGRATRGAVGEYGDNCLPRLRSYFAELEAGAERETEVKVILLGNGRVGKTQLCRRFRGEEFDRSIPSTHGVELWRRPLALRVEGEELTFHVNWWDFGGQDVYHGTHALFLRSRAIFLILWAPHLENRYEFEENGIPLRNQPLAYWLDYVRSLAGEESPVILVQSQCESFAQEQEPPTRAEGFAFHRCCAFGARPEEPFGREALETHLREAIRYLQEQNGALEIGRGRAEVRRRLYALKAEDQARPAAERRNRTLSLEEFRGHCEEVGGIASVAHALHYFHQTGVVFYQEDLFAERIVLDQSWALAALYTVFHRAKVLPMLRERGLFTRQDLEGLVWQGRPEGEQRLLLSLMVSCGICFVHDGAYTAEPTYLAPDLLPPYEAAAQRPWRLSWKAGLEPVTLRLEYRFLHQALVRGLMSLIGREAQDLAEYWKYGFWLYEAETQSQLLVSQEDAATDAQPGAGALVLQAHGQEPERLLRRVRKVIGELKIGEEPRELLTLGGATVAREELAHALGSQVRTTRGEAVDARPFEAFWRGERWQAEPREEAGSAGIRAAALPGAVIPTSPGPEVYLSYAWGDTRSRKGRLRDEVVNQLEKALQDDGFTVRRDRGEIQPGQLISPYMDRLSRGNQVVVILSEKYLRSPNCLYELYRIWQRCQGDPHQAVEHVVPIVLPGVKIGSALERSKHSDYWESQFEANQALLARRGTRLGQKSFAEVRLTEAFAQDIDDILAFLNDVLMPRKLEAHLDNGFEAVRQALWRRLAR